jgi:DNA-binding beta-propeller fold protein YncE
LPLTFPTLAAANPIGTLQVPTRHTAALTAQPAGGPLQQILQMVRHRAAAAVNHFNFPYALATDASGNLYVTNLEGANVEQFNPNFQLTRSLPTANSPLSIAVDTAANVYVGDAESAIQKFNANGAPVGILPGIAGAPVSIAVDQYQDLFILTSSGLAIDDINGNTILANVPKSAVSPIYSIAISGPNLYAFSTENSIGIVNGSALLRGGGLPFSGPIATKQPLGSACSANGKCWVSDNDYRSLIRCNSFGVTELAAHIPYSPGGVAYDATRDRLFVADPENNAVYVYTGSTLKSVATIM